MELELIPPCSSLAGLSDPKAGVRACLCMELGLPKNLCVAGKGSEAEPGAEQWHNLMDCRFLRVPQCC